MPFSVNPPQTVGVVPETAAPREGKSVKGPSAGSGWGSCRADTDPIRRVHLVAAVPLLSTKTAAVTSGRVPAPSPAWVPDPGGKGTPLPSPDPWQDRLDKGTGGEKTHRLDTRSWWVQKLRWGGDAVERWFCCAKPLWFN